MHWRILMHTEKNRDFEPTPIYYLDNYLTNKIYIKRDDFVPVSFGGNKARKALNFFKEIDQGNYDCVVTYGSSSSNHCRIISNMAAMRDIPCYIIGPSEASEPTNNQRMMELFGAEITIVPVHEVHDTIESKLDFLKSQGKTPYFIPGGGHGNLGTQAYVDCYNEILSYEKREHVFFDYIFFASGTGTTQAGLVCGQLLENSSRKIIGISIARKNPRGRNVVLDSIREYMEQYSDHVLCEDSINEKTMFLDQYTGQGYASEELEIMDEIETVLRLYGIPMDRTYTGKAFVGMKKHIKENDIKNKTILFIHTGGTPLFFDDLASLTTSEKRRK